MESFTGNILSLSAVDNAVKKSKENFGIFGLSGCIDSAKPNIVHAIGKDFAKCLLVTYSETRGRELTSQLTFFDEEVYFYPPRDVLFYRSDVGGGAIESERATAIGRMRVAGHAVIVTTFDALLDYLVEPTAYDNMSQMVSVGAVMEMQALVVRLSGMGYERTSLVERVGQFAARGGIVDVWPIDGELPIRIEFWDDEVDTIRQFDPESQRSVGEVDSFTVYPASDIKKSDEMKSGILDYFDSERTLFVLDEPARLAERGDQVYGEFAESIKRRKESGMDLEDQIEALRNTEDAAKKLQTLHTIALSVFDSEHELFKCYCRDEINVKSVSPYNNRFSLLVKDLVKYRQNGYSVIILSGSTSRAKRLSGDLMESDIPAFFSDKYERVMLPGEVMTTYGKIKQGYEFPDAKFCVISESDIFGTSKKTRRRKHKSYDGENISDFSQLSLGDYVVHENHGLGIYRGIEKITVEGTSRDCIKIEYAEGANLYIQATNLEMIQKYASADAKAPRLNRLGGREWSGTKSRVKKAVEEVAKDLVELYALRSSEKGFAFSEDSDQQTEFEERFPYEETDDQIAAIADTKRDMESDKIMDRLICGDVGYGKTEIAIRAAFKAALDGKQTVFLAPTTILASQHYKTFTERMQDTPVNVELLCRFNTPAEQKMTIKNIKSGVADIIIGTHRVLSADVVYKDLGLLIIDEEQRFGVSHKEKIKKLRKNVDVLTLTATPIPRTLHMSLVGIRDMSVLEEPPLMRQPIQTYVMEYNDEFVREAISRELSRGGQVYFVFNRVMKMDEVTAHLSELVPRARIAYANGQMNERELEDIMLDFTNGDIDVLVSTTIIETGMDISNVNTIIIQGAENLGLSQLYQLRGRVGRSNRVAYAFLMYQKDKMLKETAEKRLSAIREYTDLGSGFKIAMRDLEIRGAGNLLGRAQSGHMQSVGYDLYCKLLSQAVKKTRGEEVEPDFETMVDISCDAFIPPDYIAGEGTKLEIYKRIAAIETEEEKLDMTDELIDRFGAPPAPVENLMKVALLKTMAHQCFFTEIRYSKDEIMLAFYDRADIDPARIPVLLNEFEGAMSFKNHGKTYLLYNNKYNSGIKKLPALDRVWEIVRKCRDVLTGAIPT